LDGQYNGGIALNNILRGKTINWKATNKKIAINQSIHIIQEALLA
jgi:hypothetical protein